MNLLYLCLETTRTLSPKYLYLSIDVLSIAVPLVMSFSRKAPFYKKWKYASIAILIPAAIFLTWDSAFIAADIWGFNPRYLTGVYFYNLPLEEVLFFICIPYAGVFMYFALSRLIERDYFYFHHELISSVLSVLLMVAGVYHLDNAFTGASCLATGSFLAFQMIVLKPRYMGRFYFAFMLLFIPFLLALEILTGLFSEEPVISYNDAENMGIRIGTVPIESVFNLLLLLAMNVSIFEFLRSKAQDSD
jgi:lycopene cyclase domain-containing protein